MSMWHVSACTGTTTSCVYLLFYAAPEYHPLVLLWHTVGDSGVLTPVRTHGDCRSWEQYKITGENTKDRRRTVDILDSVPKVTEEYYLAEGKRHHLKWIAKDCRVCADRLWRADNWESCCPPQREGQTEMLLWEWKHQWKRQQWHAVTQCCADQGLCWPALRSREMSKKPQPTKPKQLPPKMMGEQWESCKHELKWET